MGYDGLNRRTQLARPNGITTSYAYDPVSHLQSILHKLGVNTLDGATYAYDAVGNRTTKTNQLNSTVSNYGYDNIYQLTGVTQAATSTETYSFDPVGNRLSSLSVPTYTYNSSNEITAAGASTFTYDNNGNTLSKSDGAGTTAYTWDFENRLTSVHLPNQTTVTFKYDPFGRRIQKGQRCLFVQRSKSDSKKPIRRESGSALCLRLRHRRAFGGLPRRYMGVLSG